MSKTDSFLEWLRMNYPNEDTKFDPKRVSEWQRRNEQKNRTKDSSAYFIAAILLFCLVYTLLNWL